MLTRWRDGRVAAIEKQTALDGASARERLKAIITLYSERMNTEAMAVELAIRQWARTDEAAAAAAASVDAARLKQVGQLYRATGCLECRMTGFRGRAGLYELLTVGDVARECISPATDMARLRKQALQDGLRPLRVAGAMKVAEGVTTMDEVLRNTPQWDR